MDPTVPTIGPFRATRLWNDLIQTFRSGMPLKKHRWRMRLYDNCFAASDSVDWLHHHLRANINFGPDVTREQTIRLLQKFLKGGVIQQVKRKDNDKDAIFEENGHLYRFTRTSPIKSLKPSALSSRTNLHKFQVGQQPLLHFENSPRKIGKEIGGVLPECKLVHKTLTQLDIEDAWKTMALASLQRILCLSSLDELISDDKVTAKHIIHNATRVTKSGVVVIPDKNEDLPYWVLSAMRCLAYWPNRIEDGLPSYPGFERDVFKTISDYFQNLPEPLLTYQFYDLFTNVLVMAERRDRGLPAVDVSQSSSTVISPISTNAGLSSFQSVENLMLDLTMAGRGNSPPHPSSIQERRSVRKFVQHPRGYRSDNLNECSFSITRGVQQYEKTWYASEDNLGIVPEENLHATLKEMEKVVIQENVVQRRGNVMYETSLWTASNKPRIYVDERERRKYIQQQKPDPTHDEENRAPPEMTQAKYEKPANHTARTSNIKNSQKFRSTTDVRRSSSRMKSSGLLKKFASLTNISSHEDSEKNSKQSNLTGSKRFGSASQLFEKIFKNPTKQRRSDFSKAVPKDVDIALLDVPRGAAGVASSSTPENNRNDSQSFSSAYSTTPSSAGSFKSVSSSRDRFISSSCYDLSSIHFSTPGHAYPPPLKATASLANLSNGSASSCNSSVYTTPPCEPHLCRTQSLTAANLAGYTAAASGTAIAQATMKRSDSATSLYSGDRSCAQEALQLCCMMLPPSNRKKLHLLLRMMSKMENNDKLNLHDSISTRQLILQTFSRSILSCLEELGLDEILAMRLVTYMMDNYVEILKVPEQLKVDVENRIAYLRRGKVLIKYSSDDENSWAFCEQLSKEEYEKQKMSSSQQAVADLLENIIKDRQMVVKEKRKKLKQFQKVYPDIYAKRLPTTASEAELFPEKPKIKQPMLSVRKPFSKLKSMR